MNSTFKDYSNLGNPDNFAKYYNIMYEKINEFFQTNNKSLNLFNNVNFNYKILYITFLFGLIVLIQFAYIYYILEKIKRVEKKILNTTEEMISHYVDNNSTERKRKCFGLNQNKKESILRRNPKRIINNKNLQKRTTFNDFFEDQKQFILDNHPNFNRLEILKEAKKCYATGHVYIE